MREEPPRRASGQFQPRTDSLYPKSIGLRVSKTNYPKFIELAQAMGIRPTELARKAVEEYIEKHWTENMKPQINTDEHR